MTDKFFTGWTLENIEKSKPQEYVIVLWSQTFLMQKLSSNLHQNLLCPKSFYYFFFISSSVQPKGHMSEKCGFTQDYSQPFILTVCYSQFCYSNVYIYFQICCFASPGYLAFVN